MPGLSASELPSETLYAGDTIEYYSRAFVCGDKCGYREAVILRISRDDAAFPVQVDTDEPLPPTNMMRRRSDRFGHSFKPEYAKWRTLRSYDLANGTFDVPTRASVLNANLRGVFSQAVGAMQLQLGVASDGSHPAAAEEHREAREGLIPAAVDNLGTTSEAMRPPVVENQEETKRPAATDDLEETKQPAAAEDLEALRSASGTQEPPSDQDLVKASEYIDGIPTRGGGRAKVRHQAKRKPGQWHAHRSRKKQKQAKCSITRSGTNIYHAKSLKAKTIKQLLRLPGVKAHMKALHMRRPVYEEAMPRDLAIVTSVEWPANVEYIEECKIPAGLAFPAIGDFDKCSCIGDCFMDTCENAASAVFCTPDGCKLGAACSNSPRPWKMLKLFDTGRVVVGVYTTTDLDAVDILGEYAGELCEYDALVEGKPNQAIMTNSGYSMLYNAKSTKKKFIYVEARDCGFTTRFISHACSPNAAFIEKQYRTSVKVLVVMFEDVKAGAQVTVHYGNETWFNCACDPYWSKKPAADK